MNNILGYLILSTLCILGTKLKTISSEFTEISPGIATGDIVTTFEIKIESNGNKKITIEEIWIKNQKAQWKIYSSDNTRVESISDKNTYTLKGEIRKKSNSVIDKMTNVKPEIQEATKESNFKEEVVIKYNVGSSSNIKSLTIEKIENLKRLSKM